MLLVITWLSEWWEIVWNQHIPFKLCPTFPYAVALSAVKSTLQNYVKRGEVIDVLSSDIVFYRSPIHFSGTLSAGGRKMAARQIHRDEQ